MANIRTVDEREAAGRIAEVYAKVRAPSGEVPAILKVQSLLPEALDTHFAFYKALMYGRDPLTRAQRELIAVAVSQANRCHY